jgi:hypothetical protein
MSETMVEAEPVVRGADRDLIWPSLPLEAWGDTYATLQRWMQIVGKIRLKLAPMTNHWWQVALYVTSCGLSTTPIPYQARVFQIDFDFLTHQMRITDDSGERWSVALTARPVADFYAETMAALQAMGIEVEIWTTPVEIADRIPFE